VIRAFLPALAALLASGCAAEAQDQAAAGGPALQLTGRVVDAADILSFESEQRLSVRLARLEEETKVQLVVATTPSLGGRTIEDYSLDLANTWELGDAARNDGLLLLVAPNDRKVRIEVGSGLEATVRDEDAAAIIAEHILPAFRQEAFERGVEAGVESLAREVTPAQLKDAA
jgi:uncharacterized protein